MVGYIYLITDTTNGMQYVGQHHYDKEELDSNYHGSGRLISRIYNKRPQTLKEEYLKTCYSQYELDEWEKYFIFLYNTLSPNGYNLEEGGRGGVPSEETRRKISEKKSGEKHHMFRKHHSDETKQKISESLKRISSSNKGKYLSEETKKKLLATHLGKPLSDEIKKKISKTQINDQNKSKKVLQFTLDGEFVKEWLSIAECGRNGFNVNSVCRCCQGKQKTAYGFVWKYKD